MLAVQMPILLLLLIPIIAIEAAILSKVLQLSLGLALRLAAFANLASTLIGIPMTWGALLGVELLSTRMRFYSILVQAPWLLPLRDEREGLIPVANLILLPFYFLASVYIEQWIMRRSRGDIDARGVRRAAWLANAATYALLLLGSLVWLLRSAGGR
jgi:hypothetical protein